MNDQKPAVKKKLKKLLNFANTLIKTDILYLAKGNFWLGLGSIVSTASSFIIVVAFGNLVSPEVYGTYRFVLSYYAILAVAGLSGFSAATIRAVAKGREGEFLPSFKIQALGSLLGSLAAFSISVYYFINQNQILGYSFLILGAALPLIESLVLYEALLAGRKEFKKLALYDVLAQTLTTVLILTAIYAGLGVAGLLSTFFAGWILTRLLIFVHVYKKFPPNKKREEKTVHLGAHLSLVGLLTNIASYLDRIIIFYFLGAAEVAIYSFAIAPAEQIKGFFKNMNLLAIPKFSQRSESALKNTMLRKMLIMILVVLAIAIVYLIAAPSLFKIFLPKYQVSVFYSQLFMFSLIGAAASLPISAMKSLSKIKTLYFYNTASAIITIVLLIVLIPLYGIMGAVIARLLSRVIGTFLSILFLRLW